MKRLHRIFANGNMAFKKFLDKHAIPHQYEESFIGKTVFLLIPETDPNWSELSRYLAANPRILHTTELRFTRRDILQAECCRLGVRSHFGYPQPEDDYRNTSYRRGSGCRACGVGWIQKAPLRVRKAPTQKRSSALQLNWIFDEFFFSRQARHQLESAGFSGFNFQMPVLHKTGEPVPEWFQMQVRHVAEPVVDTAMLNSEICTECDDIKYNRPQGELIRLTNPFISPGVDVIKSNEWFGSGARAHRLVFLSPRMTQFIIENKWRGVTLTPCQLIDNGRAA